MPSDWKAEPTTAEIIGLQEVWISGVQVDGFQETFLPKEGTLEMNLRIKESQYLL